MSNWDINKVRKLAGMPLMEAWDNDDDDEDPDAKIAGGDKGQSEFEKKASKDIKQAEQKADEIAKKKAEEAAAKKVASPFDALVNHATADKKPAKAEKAPKSDEGGEKRRGKAPDPEGKQGKARAWMDANPNATRKQFIDHVVANHEMSPHHANTFFYAYKKVKGSKTVSEMYYLSHPSVSSYVLAENRELNTFMWTDHTNATLEPLMFESKAEVERVAKYMSEWKGIPTQIGTVNLNQ
jgi:hypothetical protein